jgi:hypothetical protein
MYPGSNIHWLLSVTCTFRWDCFRHYEILAAGSVPYFFDLEKAPAQTLANLPKQLLLELRGLDGVPVLTIEDVSNAARGNATAKALMQIDHRKFDRSRYIELATRLLQYTRERLTSHQMVQYILTVTENLNAEKVLFLSAQNNPGFLTASMLHGFKTLFGSLLVDYPKQTLMYDTAQVDKERRSIRGSGVGWAGHFPDNPAIDRTRIEERIQSKQFDLIVYDARPAFNDLTQKWNELPFIDVVQQVYTKQRIIFLDGQDIW